MSAQDANREIYRTNPAAYAAAYKAVTAKFGLRARQRDLLDASPFYGEILDAALAGRWESCQAALFQSGIALLG